MGQCHHRNPDPAGAASHPVTWRQRKWDWWTDGKWISDLQDPWTAFHQNGPTAVLLPDRLTDQTTTLPNKRRKRRIRIWAKHSRLQGRPTLMGTLGVHQNIPASDTKLTQSLGIYSIGPPLVMDKLIPVNSRAITSPPEMSLLLEVEYTPSVIINQGLSLLYTHESP